jgi:hypothetical protein
VWGSGIRGLLGLWKDALMMRPHALACNWTEINREIDSVRRFVPGLFSRVPSKLIEKAPILMISSRFRKKIVMQKTLESPQHDRENVDAT